MLKHCLILILSAISFPLLAQHTSYRLETITDVLDVYPLNEDVAIIVRRKSDYPVVVARLSTEKVLHIVVRGGRGPGEIETVRASVFDADTKTLYVTGTGHKILKLRIGPGHDVVSTSETVVKSTFNPYSLTLNGEFLDYGTVLRMNGDAFSKFKDTLTVAYRLKKATLKIVEEIPFTLDRLGLDHTPDIDKLSSLLIGCRLVQSDEDLHLIFEGIPRFFQYKSNISGSPQTIEIPAEIGLANARVAYSESYRAYGFTTTPVGQSVLHHEGRAYVLFGNRKGEPYYGLIGMSRTGPTLAKNLKGVARFPLAMRCSVGIKTVACYTGFPTPEAVEIILVDREVFFRWN